MNLGVDKIKSLLGKAIKSVKKMEFIIISLSILVLFGIALLQVNEAIDPTIDEATVQKAQEEQLLKQVKYSDQSLRKIRELTNIEVELEPNTGNHSENPFSEN